MSQARRSEKTLLSTIAKAKGISKKKAKKRYVTKSKEMSFLDNW